MSILTKVLLGFVLVAIFPVVYFAAGVMNVNKVWFDLAKKAEKSVVGFQQSVDELQHGDAAAQSATIIPVKVPRVGKPGIDQLQTVLDGLKLRRSRLWYATRTDAATGPVDGTLKIRVLDEKITQTDARQPLKAHGLTDKTTLFIFQMKHDGDQTAGDDRYVGEFIVSGAPTDEQVTLKPVLPLKAPQWDAVASGSGSWIAYETMPSDQHDAFAGLTDDQIRNRLPASVVDEFLTDGKEPTDAIKNDPKFQSTSSDPKVREDFKATIFPTVTDAAGNQKTIFIRPLRNYEKIFQDLATRTVDINDRLTFLRSEDAHLKAALVNAEAYAKALDERKTKLAAELTQLEADSIVAKAHREKLEAAVAQLRQDLQTQLANNKRMTADIAAGRQANLLILPAETAAAQTP